MTPEDRISAPPVAPKAGEEASNWMHIFEGKKQGPWTESNIARGIILGLLNTKPKEGREDTYELAARVLGPLKFTAPRGGAMTGGSLRIYFDAPKNGRGSRDDILANLTSETATLTREERAKVDKVVTYARIHLVGGKSKGGRPRKATQVPVEVKAEKVAKQPTANERRSELVSALQTLLENGSSISAIPYSAISRFSVAAKNEKKEPLDTNGNPLPPLVTEGVRMVPAVQLIVTIQGGKDVPHERVARENAVQTRDFLKEIIATRLWDSRHPKVYPATADVAKVRYVELRSITKNPTGNNTSKEETAGYIVLPS